MKLLPPTIAVLIALLWTGVASSDTPVLPDDYSDGFLYHLDVLGEPDISQSCSGDMAVYRIIEIPGMADPRSIRIADDDNVLVIISVVTPDSEIETTTQKTSDANWDRLVDEMDYSGFWEMDSDWDAWRPDDMTYFVEGCEDGDYHAVKRYSESGDLRGLHNFVRNLKRQLAVGDSLPEKARQAFARGLHDELARPIERRLKDQGFSRTEINELSWSFTEGVAGCIIEFFGQRTESEFQTALKMLAEGTDDDDDLQEALGDGYQNIGSILEEHRAEIGACMTDVQSFLGIPGDPLY